jgi:predicted ABC-type exoprotein transport system permease subunit
MDSPWTLVLIFPLGIGLSIYLAWFNNKTDKVLDKQIKVIVSFIHWSLFLILFIISLSISICAIKTFLCREYVPIQDICANSSNNPED